MDKVVLIKKIKQKYLTNKKDIFKNKYKQSKETYEFLKDIADSRYLKPISGKLRKYQLGLLSFAKMWSKKFEELDIRPFLVSGNLLGAYRTGGFIPWDDDIDLGIMRIEFERLVEYLKANYKEISTDKISYSANNRSVIIEEAVNKNPDKIMFAIFPTHLQILQGRDISSLITLDIHPYDYYKDDFTPSEFKKYAESIKLKRSEINNFTEIKKFLNEERINNPNIVEKSNNIWFGIDNFDSFYFDCDRFFKTEDLFPLKTIKFEGINFYVPNKIEDYLIRNYGVDYMEMPNSISLNSHIAYRQKQCAKTSAKKEFSVEKKRIIKHLRRKYCKNETAKFKSYYKKYKSLAELMLEIVDIKHVKPAKLKYLRDYQLKIVDFAKKITDFFNSNGLEYFITSGNLIGAVRHKGFVPWDDDFDVGMMRNDYEKLRKLLKENFKAIDISKVYTSKQNKSEVVNNALKESNGEILFFDGPKYIQIIQGTSFNDFVLIDVFSHEYYKNDYTWDEHKEYISTIVEKNNKLDNFKTIRKFLDNEIESNKNVKEDSEIIYYGVDSLGSYIVTPSYLMKKSTIFPRKKMKFENYEFYAPNNPEEYIKVQYPNFWEFPAFLRVAPDLKVYRNFKK